MTWLPAPARSVVKAGEAHVWRLAADAGTVVARSVLSGYLRVDPDAVPLRRGPNGKLELEGPAGQEIRFGVAHAGAIALVVVAHAAEVGVDLEPLDRELSRWRLPSHVLAAPEWAALAQHAEPERDRRFLAMWVRKEALLKASGRGLEVDPAGVVLDGVHVLALPLALGPVSRWHLYDLPLPGFAAAVACSGPVRRMRLYAHRLESPIFAARM
jgi:4'-phosphopantetheinyl transferase